MWHLIEDRKGVCWDLLHHGKVGEKRWWEQQSNSRQKQRERDTLKLGSKEHSVCFLVVVEKSKRQYSIL